MARLYPLACLGLAAGSFIVAILFALGGPNG